MISLKTSVNFKKTNTFFNKLLNRDYISIMKKYGEKGVQALYENTPKDSGLTAASWDYDIVDDRKAGTVQLIWTNDSVEDGVPIAIILHYGHITATGGYVQGRDYILPVITPIVEEMIEEVFRKVVY